MSRRGWILWGALTTILLALELMAWLKNDWWRWFETWSHRHVYQVSFIRAPWYWRVDHHVHALVAGLATWWVWLSLSRWPTKRRYAPLIVALFLCADEFAQRFDRQRTAGWDDLGCGLAGVLLASLAFALYGWLNRRRSAT